MKQHLSVEQLNTLHFEQQEKVSTLFGQYGNCIRSDNDGNEYFNLAILSERITIGRMLEILESKSNYTQQIIHESGRYCISINPKHGYTTAWFTEYYNEPCEALWEAVMYILQFENLRD